MACVGEIGELLWERGEGPDGGGDVGTCFSVGVVGAEVVVVGSERQDVGVVEVKLVGGDEKLAWLTGEAGDERGGCGSVVEGWSGVGEDELCRD